MSLKPVYIPRRKRQRTTQEIFGRNDGDSDEDERPLDAPALRRTVVGGGRLPPQPQQAATTTTLPSIASSQQQQRPEDFMDERDHNEWGGPTRVKADFDPSVSSSTIVFHGALRVNTTMGERLLRKLGWRDSNDDGSTITAFIKKEKNAADQPAPAGDGCVTSHQEQQQSILLSQKQLQKIVRKQTHVKIPEPWRGRAGLGFADSTAPEFQAARRQRRADQDQRFQTYNVADVLGPKHAGSAADRSSHHHQQQQQASQNDGYNQNESLEDFVGYRSTAGFALREDEDDAYDPTTGTSKSIHTLFNSTAPKINRQDYEAMAYDHEDSDPDDDKEQANKISTKTVDLNALSGWAQGTTAAATGRTALPGFILGITASPQKTIYHGPTVPKDWRITPHQFGPNEHPSILQAIARAVQIEAIREQREHATQQALQAAKVSARRREGLFAAVGASMKNRFAAEGSTVTESPVATRTGESWDSITRTVHSFTPDLLLCKRLNVSPPQRDDNGETPAPTLRRTRDQAYFQDEILKVAEESQLKESSSQPQLPFDGDDEEETEPPRPELSVYKAIFDPDDASTDLSETKDESKAVLKSEELDGSEHLTDDQATRLKEKSTTMLKEEPSHEPTGNLTIPVTNLPPPLGSSIVKYGERTMTPVKNEDDDSTESSDDEDDEGRKRKKRKRRSKKKEDKRSSKKRKKHKEKKKKHKKTV